MRQLVTTAIDAVSRDDGWATLSAVGSHISKNNPSFDARNYGYAKLGRLMEKLAYVAVESRAAEDAASGPVLYVRREA